MKLDTLAKEIGAHFLAPPTTGCDEICSVYAGDRMSDLLAAANEHVLLVTHIANHGLLNLIALMDVPAICLVNGAAPDAAIVAAAQESGTALLLSPWSLYETCGRIHAALNGQPRKSPP